MKDNKLNKIELINSPIFSSQNHNLMLVKINQLYHDNMSEEELYNAVRGIWRADIDKAVNIDYVLGLYKGEVVAVFKPNNWFKVKDNPKEMPPHAVLNGKTNERIFFTCDNHNIDCNNPYLGEKYYSSTQNPVTYIWKK